MKPSQICKNDTESGHQMALIVYCQVAEKYGFEAADFFAENGCHNARHVALFAPDKSIPELKWLHAVPNGGKRGDTKESASRQGNKLKMEGVKTGVADLSWPYASTGKLPYSGLYIEMKRPAERPSKIISKGGLSNDQLEFRDFVVGQGFKWVVCYTWIEAVAEIKKYYGYEG